MQVREHLTKRVAYILAAYRKDMSEEPSPVEEIVLPESLKLLPLYVFGLIKSPAVSGTHELGSDERSWQMYLLATMSTEASVIYYYPRLLPLSSLDPKVSMCSHSK